MTVAAAEQILRHFAGQATEADPECTSMATVERRHIEAHKLWLAARPGKAGKPLAAVTIRNRLGTLRTFFERLRDWDYDDAPTKTLIFPGDFPKPTSRCRSSSTTRRWRSSPPHWRVTPILVDGSWSRSWPRPASGWASSRTRDKAVTLLGDTFSLRIPVGKLHNDRYVPIGPELVR